MPTAPCPAPSTTRSVPDGVAAELDRFVADGVRQAERHSAEYQLLWESLRETAGAGKRFRSTLLLASFRAHGGGDEAVAARVAAAVELLHSAFVIHDDVIDKDLRRRGVPNVSGVFVERARRSGVRADGCTTLGVAAGVLAGDLALVGATREVALCGADPDVTRCLLDLVTDAVRISAAGELDEVVASVGCAGHPSLDDIITIEAHKTAVYSFGLPLQAGAVLAGSPPETIGALGAVGRLAGIGFQLVDDLRGVFTDEAETGKDPLGDLREGKRTALIAHARGTTSWRRLSRYVGDPGLDAAQGDVARRLLQECGSRAYVAGLAESYLAAALAEAEASRLQPPLLGELADLCRRILRSAA